MVILKNPADVRFGVSPIPGNETSAMPFDTNTFTAPDWKGFDITPYRTGASFLVLDEDYSWNKEDAVFTLLKDGDLFYYNEQLHVEFLPLQTGTGDVIINDNAGCGCGTSFAQYPHTLRWTVRNQVTLVTKTEERKGRLEEGGATVAGINAQGNNITAIFYMSLPACIIAIGQQIDIYDNEVLLTSNTVKNFVKGFFNARVWL
jgi:hypothetical protein